MMSIEEAKQFLMENPYNNRVVATYNGEERRLFYNKRDGLFGMYIKGSKKYGYIFSDWSNLSNIREVKKVVKTNEWMVKKFKTKAQKASFTNDFIRKCLAADINKTAYENNLTSGCEKDGEVITLKAIEKEFPTIVKEFREAWEKGERYDSPRCRFRGYDMSLSTETRENGDKWGWLAMEYKDCGNGHYYIMINDNDFIYVDKD